MYAAQPCSLVEGLRYATIQHVRQPDGSGMKIVGRMLHHKALISTLR